MILFRKYYPTHTIGWLILDSGVILRTMEPPWKDNETNISCIPIGTYPVTYLERSASGRYHKVYHIQDVPERAGILIHSGNFVTHTHGCILPGLHAGLISNKPAILNSRLALNKIRAEKPTELRIILQ